MTLPAGRPPSRSSPVPGPSLARALAVACIAGVVATIAACSGGTDHAATTSSTVVGLPGTTAPTPTSVPLDVDNVPVVKVIASDEGERYRYDAPDVAPSGTIAIEVENQGQLPHDLVVLRPKATVTTGQIEEALTGPAPEAVVGLVQLLGGAAAIQPKSKQTVAVAFEPGEYYLASLARGADGRPGALHGMHRRLEVAPAPEALTRRAKPPYAPAIASIGDDGLKLPDGFGVPGWYTFTNNGTRPHELTVVKLSDGVSPDELKTWLVNAETGPSTATTPFTYLSGAGLLDPAQSVQVRLDLGSGSFVAYSAVVDRTKGNAPDYEHGLFVPFTRA